MDRERLFELDRRTFDTPSFRGIEFIEVESKSILNHVPGNSMPFSWTINPYRGCTHACTYCFARSTHTYMDMNAGRDFETKIVVKVNAPELLRKELRAKRWKGESIAMGTATDPYQRAEGRYRLMPRIIETLSAYRNPFSILTKGTLILRDIELLIEAAQVTDVATAFSIGTLDEGVWRTSEPGTPHPRKRLEAVARLNEAGIPCGVLVAPILPGISDSEEQIERVVTAAIEAGATHVSPILLHLRPKVKEVYMEWLAQVYPHLVPMYEEMYAGRSYARADPKKRLGRIASHAIESAGGLRNRPPSARTKRFTRSRTPREGSFPGQQMSLL
jgi:DNA repair photolyase